MKKTLRKTIRVLLTVTLALALLALSLTGCSNSSGSGEGSQNTTPSDTGSAPQDTGTAENTGTAEGLDFGEYTPENPLVLKFGHYGTGDLHPSNILAASLKEKLESRSGGAIQLEVYGDGILGYDVALFEAIMSGSVDFAPNNPFMMADYSPNLRVLDLHYLFDDVDQVYAYLESDVYDEVNKLCEDLNVAILGQQFLGFRSTGTRDVGIYSLEDIQGQRLRMSTSDVFVELYELYGAVPISMAPEEFVPALQQGIVDGTDLPASIQWQSNYHQYYEYMACTYHLAQFNMLNTNLEKLNSYPEEVRDLIVTAAEEACLETSVVCYENDVEALNNLEADGVTVIYYDEIDSSGFKEISDAYTVDWLAAHPECQGIYDGIRALAE